MENQFVIKFKKVRNERGSQPVYATPGAAGADLLADLEEDLLIKPGQRVKVPTGIAIEIPDPDMVGLVFARSGLAARKGLSLTNGVGVIDSDYRGEIQVLMVNLGQEDIVLQNGDRIAQIVFMNIQKALFQQVEELGDTSRGEGGFGSTGTK